MKRFWVILVSLVLVGGVGYFGWQKWSQSNQKSDKNSQQITKKYLEIPGKGIRFELTEEISDSNYFINKNGFAYISLNRFENNPDTLGCTAKGVYGEGAGLVALVEAKPGDDNFGSPWTKEELDAVMNSRGAVLIDSTYYWFEPNKYVCANPDFDEDYINSELFSQASELRDKLMDQQNTIEKM